MILKIKVINCNQKLNNLIKNNLIKINNYINQYKTINKSNYMIYYKIINKNNSN